MLSNGQSVQKEYAIENAFIMVGDQSIAIIEKATSTPDNLVIVDFMGKEVCRPKNPLDKANLDANFIGGGVIRDNNFLYAAGITKGNGNQISVDVVCKLNGKTYEIYDLHQSR